jgi:hypothetical protein
MKSSGGDVSVLYVVVPRMCPIRANGRRRRESEEERDQGPRRRNETEPTGSLRASRQDQKWRGGNGQGRESGQEATASGWAQAGRSPVPPQARAPTPTLPCGGGRGTRWCPRLQPTCTSTSGCGAPVARRWKRTSTGASRARAGEPFWLGSKSSQLSATAAASIAIGV